MNPHDIQEKVMTENTNLYEEHKSIAEQKENLPDKDEVEKFFKLPSNKGKVTKLRKIYNEGVSDIKKQDNENEREIKQFLGKKKNRETLHETAEMEMEDDILARLRKKAEATFHDTSSPIEEILKARDEYHKEVFQINEKIWEEHKEKTEKALNSINKKIEEAKEERDNAETNTRKYETKSNAVIKLMHKRDELRKKVELEEQIRLERAKNFAKEHATVLQNAQPNENTAGENAETTNEREVNEDSQVKRNKKIHKIIAAIVAGAGGAAIGAAAVGTGAALPIILTFASAYILKKIGKSDRMPFVSSFLERQIVSLEKSILTIPATNPERAIREEKLKKRKKQAELISEFTRPIFYGASTGFLVGGVFGLNTAGLISEAYAFEGGSKVAAAAAGGVAGGIVEGYLEGKDYIKERKNPERVNLVEELGFEPNVIEDLKNRGILAGEVLLLTKKEAGEIGKLQGQFHKKVMRGNLTNLNKDMYIQKIQDITNKYNRNEDFDVDEMANEVIVAST